MTTKTAWCWTLAVLLPTAAAAQSPGVVERLSLDRAIRLAADDNRQLQAARLQVRKADTDMAAARTRRMPMFDAEVTASQLLTPVDFAFPRGAFGDFPGTGPISAADTAVSVPRQPTYHVSSRVSHPLSQLFQIGLGVQGASGVST
jgi:outer membrane protein TolC